MKINSKLFGNKSEVIGSDSDDPAYGSNKVGIKDGADYTDTYKAAFPLPVAPIG